MLNDTGIEMQSSSRGSISSKVTITIYSQVCQTFYSNIVYIGNLVRILLTKFSYSLFPKTTFVTKVRKG
jgi:hypothetical protein